MIEIPIFERVVILLFLILLAEVATPRWYRAIWKLFVLVWGGMILWMWVT